jgi:hypothetical protein
LYDRLLRFARGWRPDASCRRAIPRFAERVAHALGHDCAKDSARTSDLVRVRPRRLERRRCASSWRSDPGCEASHQATRMSSIPPGQNGMSSYSDLSG